MIGTSELLLILIVALVLFGGKRLPELAKSLGLAMQEFRKASSGEYGSNEITPPLPKDKTLEDERK